MTAEFATEWCPIALLVEELDGSLKAGFPFRRFHCTHDSFTSIEQVHCHSYPTITTIALIFTQNNYINDLQSFWRTASDKLWRTHKSSHESCNPDGDPKGFLKMMPFKWMVIFIWSPVHRSCFYHLSHYFGLDFAFSTGCSHRLWPPRIEAVTTRVYSTKMPQRLRNPHASGEEQCYDEKGNASTFQSYVPWCSSRKTCFCGHHNLSFSRHVTRMWWPQLMVSALVSGFEPWPGTLRCVLGQDNLLSSASVHPGICWGVTLRWTRISSRGTRNTSSRFELQKPE